MRQWDIGIGAVGTVATISFAEINQALACVAGVLTIALLCYRVRREHKRRNYGFRHDAKGHVKTDLPKRTADMDTPPV